MIGLANLDDEPTPSARRAVPESASIPFPATVAAAHFAASAAELADGAPIGDLADLTAVVEQLVAGQQRLSAALSALSGQLTDAHRGGALATAQPHDVAALADVLHSAATATGHAADALAQSGPVLEIVVGAAGPEGRI